MEGGREVLDWIHVSQDIDQWWTLANTTMNREFFVWLSSVLLAYEEGPCSIELFTKAGSVDC
jgi:hypothetical protein